MRLAIIVALGLAVAGCANRQTAAFDAAEASFRSKVQQCNAARDAGQITRHTDEALCLRGAVEAWQPFQHVYAPLNYIATTRIALAEAVDRGDMTLAQFNAKLAEMHHQIVSEQRRQEQAEDLARSARISAWGAIKPRNCQTYGNQTYCY